MVEDLQQVSKMDLDDIPVGRVLTQRSQLVLNVTPASGGYAATFDIALDTV